MNGRNSSFPKISILIPTYNRAHYLVDAIESSLIQDYPNFEVIVSDNHSTDETEECVKKYLSDPRFRYYRNATNLGSGTNYKMLLYEYARGEYGHFLADDDYFIDKNHLRKAMQIIKKYNVKVVFSAGVSKYVECERKDQILSLGLDEVVSRQWWLENLCKTKYGLTYFPSCGSGMLFEIEKAKKLGALKGQLYGDYGFALQCIITDKQTGYIKEPSFVARRHAGQDGRTSYENAFQGMLIFNTMYELGCQLNLDRKTLEKIRFRGFKYLTMGFLMPNWINERGKSLSSLFFFLKELKKFDKRLPLETIFDINTMTQFIFYNTKIYRVLEKVYLSYRNCRLSNYLRDKKLKMKTLGKFLTKNI